MPKQQLKNPWTRRGLIYRAQTNVFDGRTYRYLGTFTTKMNFISYHLIKWWHGEEELVRLARPNAEFFKND